MGTKKDYVLFYTYQQRYKSLSKDKSISNLISLGSFNELKRIRDIYLISSREFEQKPKKQLSYYHLRT